MPKSVAIEKRVGLHRKLHCEERVAVAGFTRRESPKKPKIDARLRKSG